MGILDFVEFIREYCGEFQGFTCDIQQLEMCIPDFPAIIKNSFFTLIRKCKFLGISIRKDIACTILVQAVFF